MITALPPYISWALADSQSSLPRNPGVTAQIQAKIAMLQNPSLASDIVTGARWTEGNAASIGGRVIPIIAMFPDEAMRGDATDAVGMLERAVAPLEQFMQLALPQFESTGATRLWYGFIIGNTNAAGSLNMEDRPTYEGRTGPTRLPYDALLYHELSHDYIGNEGLNQFLEVYVHNVMRTGTADPNLWTYRRGCARNVASNEGICALLDVYELIGLDRMSAAYNALYWLRPPYGQPTSAECRQLFVDQAPESLKAQVASKMAKVP